MSADQNLGPIGPTTERVLPPTHLGWLFLRGALVERYRFVNEWITGCWRIGRIDRGDLASATW
jgi:hypothetical protein